MPSAVFARHLHAHGPGGSGLWRGTPREASRYCQQLAARHYENFSVASWLLPRPLRRHFCHVYAYCRWADDLADETGDAERSLALLDWWEAQLDDCYRGRAAHPVFAALGETIELFEIPRQPLADLLVAFRQDQRRRHYERVADVLDYCRYSANPVGRLVLYLARAHDEERGTLADSICTGLQLANFCQDVARDWDAGRVYLAEECCRAAGYDGAMFARRQAGDAFRRLMAGEVERAEQFLLAGAPLVGLMPRRLRVDVRLFIAGGLAILDRIRGQDYDVWTRRPEVSKWQQARLLAAALANRPLARRARTTVEPSWSPTAAAGRPDLTAAYEHCRQIVHRSGTSFASSFLLLPAAKRRAMYALYAYLRELDDWGDGDRPLAERCAGIDRLEAALDRAWAGHAQTPVLAALADTAARYSIPHEYLRAPIRGVRMDLDGRRYKTFAELSEYCHAVAGVVGLACIHIWGFHSAAALVLAEQCGLAFQLTNILRDIADDALRGRVYLPAEDLRRFGCSAEDLTSDPARPAAADRLAALLEFEVRRAEALYDCAAPLESLLSRDGRRAFSAMFHTYRALLAAIKARPTDVFVRRVRLSRAQKLGALCRSLLVPPTANGRAIARQRPQRPERRS